MYEIVLLNKDGKKFSKKFDSEFLYRKFLNKVQRSKKLKVLSYGRNLERY